MRVPSRVNDTRVCLAIQKGEAPQNLALAATDSEKNCDYRNIKKEKRLTIQVGKVYRDKTGTQA